VSLNDDSGVAIDLPSDKAEFPPKENDGGTGGGP